MNQKTSTSEDDFMRPSTSKANSKHQLKSIAKEQNNISSPLDGPGKGLFDVPNPCKKSKGITEKGRQ